MCRVWAHLGDPLLIDGPLFGAENSLIAQSVSPSLMSLLNLGGFGLAAWDTALAEPVAPFTYRTAERADVRPQPQGAVGEGPRERARRARARRDLRPERARRPAERAPVPVHGRARSRWRRTATSTASAHALRPARAHPPGAGRRIEGTTDTEWVYALVLSQLDEPFGPARRRTWPTR